MKQIYVESGSNIYYWGDKFAAVNKSLIDSEACGSFCPTASGGRTIDDPRQRPLRGLFDLQTAEIPSNFKVPKFDVTSEIKLEKALQELGIERPSPQGDFAYLGQHRSYVSGANAARVMIDEKGVTGAAYTIYCWRGAAG